MKSGTEFEDWWDNEQAAYFGYEDSYSAMRDLARTAFEAGAVANAQVAVITNEEIKVREKARLRDQFAMAALQGYCANANPNICDIKVDVLSQWAYEQADSMLKEREK